MDILLAVNLKTRKVGSVVSQAWHGNPHPRIADAFPNDRQEDNPSACRPIYVELSHLRKFITSFGGVLEKFLDIMDDEEEQQKKKKK